MGQKRIANHAGSSKGLGKTRGGRGVPARPANAVEAGKRRWQSVDPVEATEWVGDPGVEESEPDKKKAPNR